MTPEAIGGGEDKGWCLGWKK
ncbi:uncharacterized protein G2W53_040652 [Senna tora]|uniref:Uncharacterized protein n=1 Tax=Senna tora TaxID=362788 RepID=A0A834SDQ5_9FABA|nr:uncharacterized protein G2W53_040652 [Senna tora]